MPPTRAIYNRLPQLRAERGLSRADLAAALGIHYQTVGYLERGEYNPSLALVFDILEFFSLPMEEVFATSPFPPEPVQAPGRRARRAGPGDLAAGGSA